MWAVSLLHRLAASARKRFRQKRFAFFWNMVGRHVEPGLWLDLGGGAGSYFLTQMGSAANQAVMLDLDPRVLRNAIRAHLGIVGIVADGGRLPFGDQFVACIFCNSVLEHVAHPEWLSFEIQHVGRTFFVQTPNGRFFLEPHSFIPIPFYKSLPAWLRKLACRLARGSYPYIESVTYLPEEHLRQMFPGRTLIHERWLGMVKSFYIIEAEPTIPTSAGASPA